MHQPTFFGLHLTIRCTKRQRRQFITIISWNQPPESIQIKNGKHANVSRCWKNDRETRDDAKNIAVASACSCGKLDHEPVPTVVCRTAKLDRGSGAFPQGGTYAAHRSVGDAFNLLLRGDTLACRRFRRGSI